MKFEELINSITPKEFSSLFGDLMSIYRLYGGIWYHISAYDKGRIDIYTGGADSNKLWFIASLDIERFLSYYRGEIDDEN